MERPDPLTLAADAAMDLFWERVLFAEEYPGEPKPDKLRLVPNPPVEESE